MLPQHVLVAIIAAVGAVPLNINLGAYSPALVVGDGEISLGSTESASELMATLASGAANGQGGQQQGQQQQGGGEQQQQQEGEQQQGGEQQQEGQQEGQGGGEGEQQQEEQPAEENAAKRALSPNLVRTVDHIGKRAADDKIAAIEGAMKWIKRDLQGFNAALSYAREAQKDAPKVELGTGEAGSGVGIIVNAGLNVPANSAANGQPPAGERKQRKKRSEVVAEDSEAPKMTLVAITEV
jgi:hypothetical protein